MQVGIRGVDQCGNSVVSGAMVKLNNMQAGLTGIHKISSTFGAFAAVLIDGSMVPWGCGVFNTCDAFAVALKDGTMVTWGARDIA